MVEEDDFPVAARTSELFLKPLELCLVDVVAVQREKAYAALRSESIIALAVHVKTFVIALVRIVMVSQGSVELYSRVQERLIGRLELFHEIFRGFAAVHVVAQH